VVPYVLRWLRRSEKDARHPHHYLVMSCEPEANETSYAALARRFVSLENNPTSENSIHDLFSAVNALSKKSSYNTCGIMSQAATAPRLRARSGIGASS
jgi:hypothetical protein